MGNNPEDGHKNKDELPCFDADLSPSHEVNRRAAAARGWRFNYESGCYEDSEGCLMADRFGQPLG